MRGMTDVHRPPARRFDGGMGMTTVSATKDRPRLSGALAGALPPLRPTLAGMVLWGVAMSASALSVLLLENWETPQKVRTVAALFALGGAVAFPLGLTLARFVAYQRGREVAFAAAFLSLALATACVTGGFFALQYREYYAEWHADAFTRIWFLQFAHTVAAALYQFAVLGLRLFFPLGFVALLVASFWFARRPR
jgi:hypothetical protein